MGNTDSCVSAVILVAQSEPQTSATQLRVSFLQHGFLFFLEVSDTAGLTLAFCLLSFFSGALSKRLLSPRFHGGPILRFNP